MLAKCNSNSFALPVPRSRYQKERQADTGRRGGGREGVDGGSEQQRIGPHFPSEVLLSCAGSVEKWRTSCVEIRVGGEEMWLQVEDQMTVNRTRFTLMSRHAVWDLRVILTTWAHSSSELLQLLYFKHFIGHCPMLQGQKGV